MKILKSVLSAIGILVILIIVGSKIFHYFVNKKQEEVAQKLEKVMQYERKNYEIKLKEGYKAMQEGNYTKARLLFKDICKNATIFNMPEGCFNLGIMYLNGFGVDKNLSKAELYFKKSAEIGLIDAYGFLSYINSINGNEKKALNNAKKGCELNSAYSCFMAGAFYYDGDIVERNLTASKQYWKKALSLLPTARMPEKQKDKEELKNLMCSAMPNLCDSNLTKRQ